MLQQMLRAACLESLLAETDTEILVDNRWNLTQQVCPYSKVGQHHPGLNQEEHHQ